MESMEVYYYTSPYHPPRRPYSVTSLSFSSNEKRLEFVKKKLEKRLKEMALCEDGWSIRRLELPSQRRLEFNILFCQDQCHWARSCSGFKYDCRLSLVS